MMHSRSVKALRRSFGAAPLLWAVGLAFGQPVITTQPTDQNAVVGERTTLTVAAFIPVAIQR